MQHEKTFYLMDKIVSSIVETGKLPYLGITKQSLNYYLSTLKQKNIIEKIGYGTWKAYPTVWKAFINKTSKKKYNSFKASANTLTKKRGHGLILRLKIPKIKNWQNRSNYLKKKDIQYQEIHKGTNQKLDLKGYTVWLCKNVIVLYQKKDNSVFTDTGKEAEKEMIYDCLNTVRNLGIKLGISFRINKRYIYTIDRIHIADLDNDIAKDAANRKEIYKVKNDKGETWFQTDKSFGIEGETVHKRTAPQDMDNIIEPFLNDLKMTYEKTQELPKFSDILKALNTLTNEARESAAGLNSVIQILKLTLPKPQEQPPQDDSMKDYFG